MSRVIIGAAPKGMQEDINVWLFCCCCCCLFVVVVAFSFFFLFFDRPVDLRISGRKEEEDDDDDNDDDKEKRICFNQRTVVRLMYCHLFRIFQK